MAAVGSWRDLAATRAKRLEDKFRAAYQDAAEKIEPAFGVLPPGDNAKIARHIKMRANRAAKVYLRLLNDSECRIPGQVGSQVKSDWDVCPECDELCQLNGERMCDECVVAHPICNACGEYVVNCECRVAEASECDQCDGDGYWREWKHDPYWGAYEKAHRCWLCDGERRAARSDDAYDEKRLRS